jgi:lipid-binding SYLF domain-containing protein
MTMKLKSMMAVTGLALIALIASPACFARSKAQIDASADRAITRFYALNPQNKELAGKAAGVLIFGRVTKGGAGLAGEYGEGVLRVNGKTVDYYSVTSGSVGLTLGIAHHSEVILFMTPDSLDKFQKSEDWSAGADASFALVSQGSGGQYDTATLGKPILGFIFHEKGLLGDLSFKGSKITKIKTKD